MIPSGLFSNFWRPVHVFEVEHLLYLSAFCMWSRNAFALLIQDSMFCIPEIRFSNVVVKPPTTFSLSIQVGVGRSRLILSSATEMPVRC